MTDEKTIDHYYNKGFRIFHCSNTLPVENGGLSGPALIPYTKKLTNYIKSNYPEAKVVCGGGIKSVDDIESYRRIMRVHQVKEGELQFRYEGSPGNKGIPSTLKVIAMIRGRERTKQDSPNPHKQ